MRIAFSKKWTFITTFVLLAFLVVNIFGFSNMGGMEIRNNGTMNSCIFDGKAEICNMSIFSHINALQGMFTATHAGEQNTFLLILLSLLLAFAIASLIHPTIGRDEKTASRATKLYISQHPDITLFNTLRQAFSQGILNPKIYDSAVI